MFKTEIHVQSRLPATGHSWVFATFHSGVLAARHIVGRKRSSKCESQKSHKAQDTCCDLFHSNLLLLGSVFDNWTEHPRLWNTRSGRSIRAGLVLGKGRSQ